jgi:hypothetical protein
MLINNFIVYTILNFFLFFIGLTNVIVLAKGTRITIMMISSILFFYLAFSSFNIENIFCEYSSGWTCTTHSTVELPMAILNIGFGALCVLYIILESFGMMPKEVPEGREM